MTITSRFIHTLLIERSVSGALDDWGNPTQSWEPLATVRGLVMAKTAREVELVSQGGPVVSTHTIYMLPRDIVAADRMKLVPDDGRIFELSGVRDQIGHHLEIDAKEIR